MFLPAVALHWQLNRNACVLSNLESLIRNGRWRDPAYPEEGAWLLMPAQRATGLKLAAAQLEIAVYIALAFLWRAKFWHQMDWQTP